MKYAADSLPARFMAGDPEILQRVVRWISGTLASTRFWALRDEWADLHQEVMARVVDSLRQGRLKSPHDFGAYVRAVTRYTAREARQRMFRQQAIDALADGTAATVADSAEKRAISLQLLRVLLDHAPSGCRHMLQLYFIKQHDYAEIAAALGVPVGTVKSRMARCVGRMQRMLRQSAARDDRARMRRGRPTAIPRGPDA